MRSIGRSVRSEIRVLKIIRVIRVIRVQNDEWFKMISGSR